MNATPIGRCPQIFNEINTEKIYCPGFKLFVFREDQKRYQSHDFT